MVVVGGFLSSQEMLGIFIVISHKIQAFVATGQSFI
jgi:hypothetical protein